MDYIDKLFKQHPFIYYIGGKYYAFGVNTCTECNGKSVLLESRYKKFEESLKDDLSDEEAWRIFHKLSCEASSTEERTCVYGDGNGAGAGRYFVCAGASESEGAGDGV